MKVIFMFLMTSYIYSSSRIKSELIKEEKILEEIENLELNDTLIKKSIHEAINLKSNKILDSLSLKSKDIDLKDNFFKCIKENILSYDKEHFYWIIDKVDKGDLIKLVNLSLKFTNYIAMDKMLKMLDKEDVQKYGKNIVLKLIENGKSEHIKTWIILMHKNEVEDIILFILENISNEKDCLELLKKLLEITSFNIKNSEKLKPILVKSICNYRKEICSFLIQNGVLIGNNDSKIGDTLILILKQNDLEMIANILDTFRLILINEPSYLDFNSLDIVRIIQYSSLNSSPDLLKLVLSSGFINNLYKTLISENLNIAYRLVSYAIRENKVSILKFVYNEDILSTLNNNDITEFKSYIKGNLASFIADKKISIDLINFLKENHDKENSYRLYEDDEEFKSLIGLAIENNLESFKKYISDLTRLDISAFLEYIKLNNKNLNESILEIFLDKRVSGDTIMSLYNSSEE